MKKLLSLCLLGCSLPAVVYAADSDNDCARFHIQISNLTKETCVLTSQPVVHGNLINPPATSILSGDSKRFDMTQTVFGPAITLSYQCGSENITFTSQQNLCFIEGGNVMGTILHPMPRNIRLAYTALPGSFFWGRAGSINWSIQSFS